jgi:hypothetical protein
VRFDELIVPDASKAIAARTTSLFDAGVLFENVNVFVTNALMSGVAPFATPENAWTASAGYELVTVLLVNVWPVPTVGVVVQYHNCNPTKIDALFFVSAVQVLPLLSVTVDVVDFEHASHTNSAVAPVVSIADVVASFLSVDATIVEATKVGTAICVPP